MRLRKILLVILAFALVISTVPAAAATEKSIDNIVTELNAYGILRGDENGDFRIDDEITRADVSAMLVRTLKLDDMSFSEIKSFSDVKPDDWFYGDVHRLVNCNVIQGYTDGTFHPLDNVLPNEAVKMLVCALGYSYAAQMKGGYPDGYMAQAAELGIIKGVHFGDKVTRADMARMIYNAMDVPLVETRGPIIEIGKTYLRDLHLYEGDNGAFIKRRGIVEANADTWLVKPYNSLNVNRVVIDGRIYDIGETDAYKYLGMEVDFYASAEDVDGIYTIESIEPTKQNKTVTFTEHEYNGFSENVISGEVDGKDKQFRLASDYILIRNMDMVRFPLPENFDITRGTVTIIDNDDDSRYDIVFIDEFDSLLVERADAGGIRFREGTINGRSMLPVYDEDVLYYITNSDGEMISIEEIEPFSVISVETNADETVYKIRVNDKKLTGTVEQISEDGIVIDGEELVLESGVTFNVATGDRIGCYLNFRGEAAFADISEFTDEYAYVAWAGSDDNPDTVLMQLVLPGSFTVDKKTDSEDEDATAIPILKAHNNVIKSYKLSRKVKLNGVSVTAKEAAQRMNLSEKPIIRFTTNKDGEITSITEPEAVGTDVFDTTLQRTYNGNELVFGGLSMGAFGVGDETKALCIPDSSGIEKKQDYLAGVEMVNNGKYSVNGYDLLPDSENARLVVLRTMMRYDSDYGFDENKAAILEDKLSTYDDGEGEFKAQLTFWSEGKRQTMTTDEETAAQLKAGDVFLYSLGVSSNEIAQIERIANPAKDQCGTVTIPGNVSSRYATLAIPVNVEYNRILDSQVRRADVITVKTREDSENETTFNIFKRNAPPVYIYNTGGRKHEVSVGTTDDIIVGGDDKVFFYSSAQKIRICVIVR